MTAPAERLLAAADLLDKRAGEATEGPWVAEDPHNGRTVADVLAYNGLSGTEWHQVAFEVPIANAAYIATMHPEVGKALAAWLREEARSASLGHGWKFEAVALADLLLAGES